VFSPDGKSITFGRITGTASSGEQLEAIYVVGRRGGRPRQVVPPTPALEHPDWSPDGRWITFNIGPETRQAPQFGSVLAVHPDGRGLRVLAPATEDRVFFKPVWSPDGRRLLTGCADPRNGLDQLCVMDANGTNTHVVVDGALPVNFPAWGTER
jgi:Tol biopolymer transport system component